MEVAYGETPINVPVNASNTEITTYLWTNSASFLGEFDSAAQTFTAWELIGPTHWLPRPDIVAPPSDCIGTDTTPARKWSLLSQAQQWILLPSQVWRQLKPQAGQQTQLKLQAPSPKKQPARRP